MQVYYPYIIPLEIVLVQLCGTYLRYLPFQEMLADIQKKDFCTRLCSCPFCAGPFIQQSCTTFLPVSAFIKCL